MKAWLLEDFKGLGALRVGDAPEPIAGEDEAILEVRYAALNPADRYLAERQYPAKPRLPHILGRDGMGIVVQSPKSKVQSPTSVAQSDAVEHVRVGQKMMVLRGEVGVEAPGTFAQRVAVPVRNLVEVPSGWSDEESAGATLTYLTAYQALTMWGGIEVQSPRSKVQSQSSVVRPSGIVEDKKSMLLRQGYGGQEVHAAGLGNGPPEVVLVTGASGGVGVAAVQLASAMGHTVLALSRSKEKQKRLLHLGAAVAFDTQNPAWPKEVKDWLAANRRGEPFAGRVTLAIDGIGGNLLPQVIETLGDLGRVSVVGRLAGPVPNFNTASLLFRRIRIGGVAIGAYSPAESRSAWQQVLELLSHTGARPIVDSIFPFDQLPKAFERLAKGPVGKVLLKINS